MLKAQPIGQAFSISQNERNSLCFIIQPLGCCGSWMYIKVLCSRFGILGLRTYADRVDPDVKKAGFSFFKRKARPH